MDIKTYIKKVEAIQITKENFFEIGRFILIPHSIKVSGGSPFVISFDYDDEHHIRIFEFGFYIVKETPENYLIFDPAEFEKIYTEASSDE